MIKGYLLKQPKRNPRPRGERHQRPQHLPAEKAQDGRNVCVPKCHKLALFVVVTHVILSVCLALTSVVLQPGKSKVSFPHVLFQYT